jgi:hypothetical protein
MGCNIGTADRILRITLGLSFIECEIFVAGTKEIVMSVVRLIPLATSSLENCPAYTLFKINTCQSRNIKSV